MAATRATKSGLAAESQMKVSKRTKASLNISHFIMQNCLTEEHI